MMLRMVFWFIVWCCCLGFVGIHVHYADGLEIELRNHKQRKQAKKKLLEGE